MRARIQTLRQHLSLWADVPRRLARPGQGRPGQSLTEYALILALIAVVAIGALELLGARILEKLNTVAAALQ